MVKRKWRTRHWTKCNGEGVQNGLSAVTEQRVRVLSADAAEAQLRQPAQQFQTLSTATWQLILFTIFEGAFQMCVQAVLFLVHVQGGQTMSQCGLQLLSIAVGVLNACLQIYSECTNLSWLVSKIKDTDLNQELLTHAGRQKAKGKWPGDLDVNILWNHLSAGVILEQQARIQLSQAVSLTNPTHVEQNWKEFAYLNKTIVDGKRAQDKIPLRRVFHAMVLFLYFAAVCCALTVASYALVHVEKNWKEFAYLNKTIVEH